MNNILKSTLIAVAAVALTGCSDLIDTKSPNLDSEGYFETELGLSEGLNAAYLNLYFSGDWGAPSHVEWDNWSPYGMVFREESVGIGSGYGITPDHGNIQGYYAGNYRIVARANTVISGNNGKWVEQSDDAKRHYNTAYAEQRCPNQHPQTHQHSNLDLCDIICQSSNQRRSLKCINIMK